MKKARDKRLWILRFAVYLLVIVMLFRWFEHNQVYHPGRTIDDTPASIGMVFEDVFFKSDDGVELHGWYCPASGSSVRKHIAVLFCHGNGGNISHRLEFYRALTDLGLNVFTFDYRGYGRSKGRPGEEGTYRDAVAAYQSLRGRGFEPRHIVVYGESLGGGIASELCLRADTGGLILQSTFTSIPDIGAQLYPWLPVRLMSTIKYDTHGKLPRIKVPVLVMHSREDGLVGFLHSETNYAAANSPKMFCELTGGHNEAVWQQHGFLESIEKFLQMSGENPGALPAN